MVMFVMTYFAVSSGVSCHGIVPASTAAEGETYFRSGTRLFVIEKKRRCQSVQKPVRFLLDNGR